MFEGDFPEKYGNSPKSVKAGTDWVADNLTMLASNCSFSSQVPGPKYDGIPMSIGVAKESIHPAIENDKVEDDFANLSANSVWKNNDELLWIEQVFEKPIHGSYNTWGENKKLISDSLKSTKWENTKKLMQRREI